MRSSEVVDSSGDQGPFYLAATILPCHPVKFIKILLVSTNVINRHISTSGPLKFTPWGYCERGTCGALSCFNEKKNEKKRKEKRERNKEGKGGGEDKGKLKKG